MRPTDTWPLIIGGSHRSGTTLLRRLLNGHPRIFCPPEIKFFKDLLGQFPDDPLAHGRLGASLAALGLPQTVWLDQLGQGLVRCYDMAATAHGKVRWADKSPENAINIHHWDRLLKGQFHFIMVLRHPFDVIASMAEVRMDKVLPLTLEERASHVREYMEMGLEFVDRNPMRSTLVRYEHLVRDPIRTLSNLLNFIGEEFCAEMIARIDEPIHGRGLGDPKARGRTEIVAASVDRWKREFTDTEIGTLTSILSGLLDRLGYSQTSSAE